MSRAIDLAKECGLRVEEGLGYLVYSANFYGVTRADLETFYRRAQMEELEACLLAVRDEALTDNPDNDEDRAYNAAIFDAAFAIISRKRRMAKELEAG